MEKLRLSREREASLVKEETAIFHEELQLRKSANICNLQDKVKSLRSALSHTSAADRRFCQSVQAKTLYLQRLGQEQQKVEHQYEKIRQLESLTNSVALRVRERCLTISNRLKVETQKSPRYHF
jgi:uncharacterized damage-inducible protein DinB